MPQYLVLYRFTDQGRAHMKDTVHRASEFRELNETAGFEVLGMWWTQGQYDLVVAVDAPSEESMVSGLFNIAEAGNVVSETLRAFTPEELQRMIGP
ncbi:MAG TPA: GYD domain-containing protein [Dehalococcoidia bacterium]|nr:GYD domain-containing protein [Dehalococcoidia bacterium]